MRQETGKSNSTQTTKKVSIQVKLGGRSFSASNIVADNADVVEFVIDTPRVTLAPREAITPDNTSSFLTLCGKACHINEQSVCSELQSDIVAIMAIDSEALASIVEKWGSRASFSSPLLDMRHSEESCLTIDASEKVCYMHLFNNGLQRAEANVATTAEDILYLVTEWLGGNDTPIYIKGSSAAAKLLRKYFKRVVCE